MLTRGNNDRDPVTKTVLQLLGANARPHYYVPRDSAVWEVVRQADRKTVISGYSKPEAEVLAGRCNLLQDDQWEIVRPYFMTYSHIWSPNDLL
jgi:hypothetical protein